MTNPAPTPSRIRMAYVDATEVKPAVHAITPEGVVEFTRVPEHGVILATGGSTFSIPSDHLPFLARYLLAVAVAEGVDINAGWTP